MVDERNNFPHSTIFSSKSPWPNRALILNLQRFTRGRLQLDDGTKETNEPRSGEDTIVKGVEIDTPRAFELAGCVECSEVGKARSTRAMDFDWVGLAFYELRVSIRVDVKCLGQLPDARSGQLPRVREASESFGGILDDE